MLPKKDVERLRALASQQAEIAAGDAMKQIFADWNAHGRFEKNARPMLTVEMWTFADEIIPAMLQCESPEARELETQLLLNILPHTMFGDDTPVRDFFHVPLKREFIPFNMPLRKTTADDSSYVGAGHRFETYLHDLEEDFDKLGKSRFSVDLAATQAEIDRISEIFGDALPVRRGGESIQVGVAEQIMQRMSMEDLYVAMLDTPELVHRMVDMLIDDYNDYCDYLEQQGVLLPTVSAEELPQGSWCFTNALPDSGAGLKSTEVWGYMDAEEMNDVSPEMYKEFISDHYKRLTPRFGALSYGCCEAIHRFWDDSVENLPKLKKVSVSAWCDVKFMGERLRGKDIVFVRKPTANMLGVKHALDEDEVTRYYRETAEAASGCRLEVTQRDVYLLHGNIDKVRRYVELGRAALEKYWKP